MAQRFLRLLLGRCCEGPVEVRLVAAGRARTADEGVAVDAGRGSGRAAFKSRNVLRW